ncbi:hypothetical protein C2G38_2217693, partial [Gigaspora rosea]
MQSKNNLQKLLSSGVITEFSYNFSILSVNIKNQLVWDFDSETISSQSSIHQESTVQESTTRIIDLPYTNDNEVLQEMNNWEYAVKNNEYGELIDNFKYISNQNGYVRMSDTANNIYF